MEPTLEELLERWLADATVLDRNGFTTEAGRMIDMQREVKAAAKEYLAWLDEPNAQTYTGKSVNWLRDHFSKWEKAGHARKRGTMRQYRQIVLPPRQHVEEMVA